MAPPSEARPKSGERLACLDALRGLMALSVAAYHLCAWTHVARAGGKSASALAALGIFSVEGFFLLSGLCFFHTYAPGSLRGREWLGFYVRRFFRIAPLFYLVAALDVALGRAMWAGFRWDRLFENVSLSFALFHPNHALVLGGWSIGIECVFYALFPLLSWSMRTPTLRWVAAALLLALAIWFDGQVAVSPEGARFNTYVRLPNHLFLFALGASFATLPRLARVRLSAGFTCSLTALALLAASRLLPPVSDHFALMHGAPRALGVALCAALVALAALGRDTQAAWFRPLRGLGELSYAVYLLHPLAWLAVQSVRSLREHATSAFAAGLALTLLLAWCVHTAFERPLLQQGKRLAQRVSLPLDEAHAGEARRGARRGDPAADARSQAIPRTSSSSGRALRPIRGPIYRPPTSASRTTRRC